MGGGARDRACGPHRAQGLLALPAGTGAVPPARASTVVAAGARRRAAGRHLVVSAARQMERIGTERNVPFALHAHAIGVYYVRFRATGSSVLPGREHSTDHATSSTSVACVCRSAIALGVWPGSMSLVA